MGRPASNVLRNDAYVALVTAVLEDHADAIEARDDADISRTDRVHITMLRRYVSDLAQQ